MIVNSVEVMKRLADELAIRALHSEYCLRLELDSFEDWMDLFTQDTVYEVHRRVLTGKDEVRAMLSQAPEGLHLGGPERITLDGDSAETVQNYLFIGGADARWNMGWYFRTLRRENGEWKIARTVVKIHKFGSGTPPLLERAPA
ncbi:MAG: nuclear transport factor 2 family protein [Sphingomonadales bacterium]|nr:nuclear transport factor 2 family protein [Sphingomonadales bacterium]